MFCLQVQGPIVGPGGGAVADSDLQIRGGAVIQSLRKRGGGSFFRPQFGLKIRRGGGGGGARAPPQAPPPGGFYNRQFTVIN